MVKHINVNWTVTGYHRFTIKPSENEYLRFQREKDKVYDPYAILVKLKDGRTIGRVPANLCRLLIKLKEHKIINGLKCQYTGICTRSTTPHFSQRFQKGESVIDKNGGGVILSANYEIIYADEKYEHFKSMVKEHIPENDLRRFCI